MARKVKCPECGTFNDKENAVCHNSKYYCKVCYENKMRESQDYKDLITYICNLYQIDSPTGWMLKQIKDFKEQFNYTYRVMKTTLHYFYEIQEGNDVTLTFKADHTVDDMLTTLAGYGISGQINNGRLTISTCSTSC